MKNLFFALAFMLIGTFAFANTMVEPSKELVTIENIITIDVEKTVELTDVEFKSENNVNSTYLEVENTENAVIPCRWRTCYWINGEWACTAWTYGDCIIIIQ